MLGLINDCAEQLVITKFGIEAWHSIKESAGCTVKDYGFEQHGAYPDSATIDIVVAAAEALSVTVDDLLELFGKFFIEYTISKGYDNLLRCQGSTLRLWLSNLNAMHDHLQSSLPAGNFPVFWCENCVDYEGSIILHYYSVRGALLGSLVVGIVKEVAILYFDVEVKMERIAVQGEDGSQCTTWRITALDPEEKYKLTMQSEANADEIVIYETMQRRSRRRSFETEGQVSVGSFLIDEEIKCPFSQATGSMERSQDSFQTLDIGSLHKVDTKGDTNGVEDKMSTRRNSVENLKKLANKNDDQYEHGLPSSKLRSVFPYHVMVNHQFKIVQLGNALPDVLMRDYEDLIGLEVDKVFKFTKPVLAGFHWPTLQRLADQKFFLSLVPFIDPVTGAKIEEKGIKFKGNLIQVADGGDVMFVLSPDAENISELTQMGLTMSDLPLHSFQRDVVFLGEHIASEVRTAHKLDRLSKKLENEKNLSNTLLNSMLPAPVAESLRSGKTVEPQLYENCTIFFSDVVGFTKICDAVEPWDVIDMLNQLYTIMDFLASRFNLYKVETIGDAYMCCSGLPTPDMNHAQNIANFALAVTECVTLVLSPADGTPLQLRIGIHTGHCMGGVVGTLTPHYCLFGDMVNTTSRHESTSLNGKIQCSNVLYEHLAEYSSTSDGPQYKFTPRGYVEMKGKGRRFTYWLESGTGNNESASPKKIKLLRSEVSKVLSKKKWKKRKYFNIQRHRSIGDYDETTLGDDITIATGISPAIDVSADEVDGDDSSRNTGTISDEIFSSFDIASHLEMKPTEWEGVKWNSRLSRIDLVAAMHGLLSSMLWMCATEVIDSPPEDKELLDSELLRYVDRISSLYPENSFHNWDHACQVTLSATFLVNEYHEFGVIDKNPFVRFITVFSALIHDVKHLGLPNMQLAKEGHSLSAVYQNSYLERQSIQVGLGIFIEEFPELSTSVLKMCPEFIHLVTSAVLATDVSNSRVQQTIQDRFDRLISGPLCSELERTQSVVEQFLLMADVGHCSQSYENFLKWNEAFFHECLNNHKNRKGFDPRNGWFQGEISFLEAYILPLTERVGQLLPQCNLSSGTKRILKIWKENGEKWTQNLVEASSKAELAEEEEEARVRGD